MKTIVVVSALLILTFSSPAAAQSTLPGRAGAHRSCQMTGAYRIDVANSDRLYSVVKDATSSVPFGTKQQFFMDLSVRLTPPDLLAIECQGNRVSVASSRAPRVSFLADGRMRQERRAGGKVVQSSVVMDRNTLTFRSSGNAEDNVNVSFRSIDGGQRLQVTRRIDAEQLAQPIVIQTVYDRIADTVNWNTYGGDQVTRQRSTVEAELNAAQSPTGRSSGGSEAAVLRNSLNNWIAATNERDIDRQMSFYASQLEAFYLSRNTLKSAVRLEKRRVFQGARSVDIRAEAPEIIFQDGGRNAVMRFRKKYSVSSNSKTRSGEVVQELRWQRTNDGWRIYSERDIRVIR